MVRVSFPAKLRPWSELTAKMVMGVVPGLVIIFSRETKKTARIRKKEGFIRTPPNRSGPSSSLSNSKYGKFRKRAEYCFESTVSEERTH